MYALLLTEALDKNFKSHRNDSLILIAVDYYKDNSNNKLKTKAYYYLGRVYQDNKEYIKATEAYLTTSNIKYIDNQLVTVIKIQMICKCKYKTI